MCAYCKMAISEKRYAAEAIDYDGIAYKFDNAFCMTRFVAERKLRSRIGAWYIASYETRSWVDARKAAYAKSAEIPSPMASGLAAFSAKTSATEFAAAHHGKTIAFEDLWTSVQ
jgi:copper chaperone NosL